MTQPDNSPTNPYKTPPSAQPSLDASGYRTTPIATSGLPPGIPYIVANEAAERFSFYGMRAILMVFMTQHLLGFDGQVDPMSESDAKFWFHIFVMVAYFTPLLGAILADCFWGKYRTIIWLSILYCFGHLALAVDETRVGLLIGLSLIALGTGAIKPCVASHVGDQFGTHNKHLLERVFGWFYLSINFGAFASTLLTPLLLKWYGPSVAFGVPGVLMAVATLLFWMGRRDFAHVPARGPSALKEVFQGEGLRVVLRLLPVYLLVAVFWSLFDQTASAWVLQAGRMDTTIAGVTILPSQIQAANPMLILMLVPLFSYLIYPWLNRVVPMTSLRRISIGMFLTVIAFSISALIEQDIQNGGKPNIGWQILAYVVLTSAEVMVSINCLEFSYTQAPNSVKSFIMSFYSLSIALGNLITAVVNKVIQNPDGSSKLPGASYYWFFTGMMAAAAVLFVIVALTYRGKTYSQDMPSS